MPDIPMPKIPMPEAPVPEIPMPEHLVPVPPLQAQAGEDGLIHCVFVPTLPFDVEEPPLSFVQEQQLKKFNAQLNFETDFSHILQPYLYTPEELIGDTNKIFEKQDDEQILLDKYRKMEEDISQLLEKLHFGRSPPSCAQDLIFKIDMFCKRFCGKCTQIGKKSDGPLLFSLFEMIKNYHKLQMEQKQKTRERGN